MIVTVTNQSVGILIFIHESMFRDDILEKGDHVADLPVVCLDSALHFYLPFIFHSDPEARTAIDAISLYCSHLCIIPVKCGRHGYPTS